MDDRDIAEMYPPTIYKERHMIKTKINPEKLTVNNIEFIVDICEDLRAYHNEQYCDLDNSVFMRKYHEGRANAYASVLDMFEARGIIEEKNDGQT